LGIICTPSVTLAEFQFVVDDVEALQKQQDYLKVFARREALSVENAILLKDLKRASSTSNSGYFSTRRSRASNRPDPEFRKRAVVRVVKSSSDDDPPKKRAAILKITPPEKFSDEEKYESIVDEDLKLFLRKLL